MLHFSQTRKQNKQRSASPPSLRQGVLSKFLQTVLWRVKAGSISN